jgi:regulator of protease activity HflC (stomatin/prohibitin superfamily)
MDSATKCGARVAGRRLSRGSLPAEFPEQPVHLLSVQLAEHPAGAADRSSRRLWRGVGVVVTIAKVPDPVRSVYEIANLPDAIEKLTQTTLRNVIGELDLDETLTSRDTINAKLRVILDEAADKWGVKVNRVELQDISPPDDVKGAMEKQMRAERDRRAAILAAEGAKTASILQAEGLREAEIRKAEGYRQARILTADGEAEARRRIAEAESQAIQSISQALTAVGANPASYLLGVRYIDALKEMVSGKDNKVVYLPYEATAALGSLGGIREMLGSASPQPSGSVREVRLP